MWLAMLKSLIYVINILWEEILLFSSLCSFSLIHRQCAVVNYLINSISKKNTRLCWWPMVSDYTISISQKDTDHILKIYFIIINLISGSYINTKCIPVCAAMVNILQLWTHFLHLITINPTNLTFSTHTPHTLS